MCGIIGEVADIGDVADQTDGVTKVFKPVAKNVKDDGTAGVAEMRFAIDGRTTKVQPSVTGRHRFKRFGFVGLGVVKLERHGDLSVRCAGRTAWNRGALATSMEGQFHKERLAR